MFLILNCNDCGYSKSVELDKGSRKEELARFDLKQALDEHVRKTGHANIEIVEKGLDKIPTAVKKRRREEEERKNAREVKVRKRERKANHGEFLRKLAEETFNDLSGQQKAWVKSRENLDLIPNRKIRILRRAGILPEK